MLKYLLVIKGSLIFTPCDTKKKSRLTLSILQVDWHPNLISRWSFRVEISKQVTNFCNQFGTSLRLLEESTQWENRSELYIVISKEATQKDIRSTNCTMCLWNYCANQRSVIYKCSPKDIFKPSRNTPYILNFGV